MPKLIDLLGKGYFPKELPPPFTTRKFSATVVSQLANLPQPFIKLAGNSLLTQHSLARPGKLRRQLGIPNPIRFFQLAELIHKHWSTLDKHCRRSRFSLSRPVYYSSRSRAIAPLYEMNILPLARAKLRAKSRFILKTDVAGFYPSLYTHSIPWAIHGKQTAKTNRSLKGAAVFSPVFCSL